MAALRHGQWSKDAANQAKRQRIKLISIPKIPFNFLSCFYCATLLPKLHNTPSNQNNTTKRFNIFNRKLKCARGWSGTLTIDSGVLSLGNNGGSSWITPGFLENWRKRAIFFCEAVSPQAHEFRQRTHRDITGVRQYEVGAEEYIAIDSVMVDIEERNVWIDIGER